MKIVTRIKDSHFAQSVAILATGTAIAQAIPVLASPVLTRLYTPADFGVLAVFMALVSSVTPIVCGKYEVAMLLPRSQVQGRHLLGVSLQFSFVVSVTSLILIILLKDDLLKALGVSELGRWVYLAPIALFLTGFFLAMGYFSNRYQHYNRMAKSKLIQSLIAVTLNIGLGVMGFGFEGLLLGNLAGLSLASLYLFYLYKRELTSHALLWGKSKALLVKRYIDYPLLNASGGLLDGVTLAMPIFFLTHFYPESIVGYFSLVTRVANSPLSFISSSVSQVNLKKIVNLVNSGMPVRPYLLKLTIILCLVAIAPSILFMLIAPELFARIFGSEWREAGVYVQILMPAIAVRFVASTLSSTLGATKNNHLGFLWKIAAFIITILVYSLFAPKVQPVQLFKYVVIMDVMLYFFYYWLIWKAAGLPRNSHK